jgi:hypothetical protein
MGNAGREISVLEIVLVKNENVASVQRLPFYAMN